MTELSIRVATEADLAVLVRLQSDTVRWLAAQGLDQWQPTGRSERQTPERMQQRIEDAVGRGECYVAVDGFRIAAMAIVDELADPEFWHEEDEPRDALYVHRVIVDRGYAGSGLGEALVDFASKLAADRGKSWLRLDAWRTNLALHGYYRRQGFDHVRTVSLPHRGSGVLFQRRAGEASRGTVRFERMERMGPEGEELRQGGSLDGEGR
ncbi:GNAT family N-acetyltransferase [Micromonospora sp. PTRAS2]